MWRKTGAYVVCRDNRGRLLLVRVAGPDDPDRGKWTLPGGGMDWGESPEQTARRELTEETGLTARIGRPLGVFSRWVDDHESTSGRRGHVVGIIYPGHDLSGETRPESGGSTDGVAWYSLDEAQSVPHVPLVDFALDLID